MSEFLPDAPPKRARGPKLHVSQMPLPRLRRVDSLLLIVDMQERLLSAMPDASRVLSRSVLLARACRELEIPVLATEQNPSRLGATSEALSAQIENFRAHAKMEFSAVVPEIARELEQLGRPTIVICGLETHVCVLQTALDLRERGHTVFVAADAVASRYQSDADVAWQRLSAANVQACSVESAIYEWMGSARHEAFKTLLPFVK